MQYGNKFRIYPTKAQQTMFRKTFGCKRKVWNERLLMLMDTKGDHYVPKKLRVRPQLKVSDLKQIYPYLKEVDSLALSNTNRDLTQAINRYFKDKTGKIGFPTQKHRKRAQSYQTNNQHGTVRLAGGYLRLPKIGWVKIKQHRSIKFGQIKTVTVSQNIAGQYFVTLLVTKLPDKTKLSVQHQTVGIDLNSNRQNAITLSNGEIYPTPNLNKLEQKLHREQQILARRKHCAQARKRILDRAVNYQRQLKKIGHLQTKITNIRRNWRNQTTKYIVDHFDEICIENLSVKGMLNLHSIAKHTSETAFYELKRQLTYKCEWYGRQLHVIDRWFPSSQLCSNCGYQNHDISGLKGLRFDEWNCPQCGQHHLRHVNAAINIEREGLIQA